jgi:hypothetical protein
LLFVALSKTDEASPAYLYLMDPNGLFVCGLNADTLGTAIADKIRETMAHLPVRPICKPAELYKPLRS